MARAALGWSLTDLASASAIGRASGARFELGQSVAPETIAAIRRAYEAAGVILISDGEKSPGGGAGVRLRG
jgi:transcriptional regulator with XRE-family HTH domain